jgi:CP family cyanate transporter-like MFS transporter
MRHSVTSVALAWRRRAEHRPDYDATVTELPARPSTRATPPMPQPPGAARPGQVAAAPSALLIAGVVLMAANMRPLATSVGPLIHQIRAGEHLSGAAAGLLLTIPVLCFGAIAPLAPLLRRRLGIARTVALVLFAIVAGLLLRVAGGVFPLFAGTALAAAGAACGNVLLPVVVRRSFSDRVGRMSSFYTTALVGTAAIAAGATVPLANALGEGWRGGLAVWAAPAIVALAVWLPQLAREPAHSPQDARQPAMREVTRNRLTWQLTVFFALQSWGFYATLAWLPSIFESHGIGSTSAGLLLGLCGIMAVPAALVVPALATRYRDQSALAVAVTAITLVGYGGLLLAPGSAAALWAIVIGIGQGAVFPLALTMIVLRTGSAALTAGLSTHVQCVGYLLAAAGPFVIGALHDATGSWTFSLVLLIVILVPQALTGAGAGRSRTLSARVAASG